MISVLLPSRGRPRPLVDSIASLTGNASRPRDLDVHVACDPDDPDTRLAALQAGATVHIARERYGYPRLHEYINRLAAQALGDWLLLWNDDARMLTPGWDTLVDQQAPAVLWPHSNDIPTCNTFPIWPRAWTDHLGHVSLSPHCDSWIQDLGTALGHHRRIPVRVLHDRADLTGGHDDATRAESPAGYRTVDYHTPAMQAARRRDAELLQAHLAAAL